MTQEDKDLLLKDLCARLPYGVKVYDIKSSINSSFMNLNHVNGTVKEVFISYMHKCRTAPIEDIKPYLFPLSNMTSKQRAELSMLVANEYDMLKSFLIEIEFYHKHHFDYRGLIGKSLALDATNLGIY